ncbi:MAG: phosphate acetyltransferase [Desulfovibrionaceae bacterium]|jgi:phosphate acetyltransferase|nr:phosphate acetyltransferase [Desulfovibrionaceae bacterium]
MAKCLYLTTTEPRSGKSAVSLGLMQMLLRDVQNVGVFRPVITVDPNDGKDYFSDLLIRNFGLEVPPGGCHAYTTFEARDMINAGRYGEFLDGVLVKFSEMQKRYDFVLTLGTDFSSKDITFEFDVNADIAANLGCPVCILINAFGKSTAQTISSTRQAMDAFYEKSVDIAAVIVNRVQEGDETIAADLASSVCGEDCPLFYVIPEEPVLGKPTMEDVRKWLDAKVLFGEAGIKARVDNHVIAAMQVHNFLSHVEPGSLIITPGDREDVLLASLATRLSRNYPPIAGILLTGGITPGENVTRLMEGLTDRPTTVLGVRTNTFKTMDMLKDLYGRIEVDDQAKIAAALAAFERAVDQKRLADRLISRVSTKMTPRMFEFSLIQKAQADKMRIVLPEGEGERILRATDILLRRGVAHIALLGDEDVIRSRAAQYGLDIAGARILTPDKCDLFEEYSETYYELRKSKGVTPELARDAMCDPTFFGTMMVYKGDADGMVSGSVTTTAATIRPAFQFIKTKPNASIVSSVFLMCLKDRVLVFGDCAVNPNPDARQLAEIAISSADTAKVFGIEPRVAMLSYSTGSSGKGEQVEKVIQATQIARELAPHLAIEGPLQYDAAIDPEVAKTKMPGSEVAGHATVFIFPDLNTGNNTYKAVQRAAQAVAIGPVLQGLNKPVNDLSRGCTVPDIVNTVAITAIQAQAEAKAKAKA